jgi:hypothetical protein
MEVEISVYKVPEKVEIGGNQVEIWWENYGETGGKRVNSRFGIGVLGMLMR